MAFTQHEWLRAAQSEQRRTSAANRLAHSVPCLHRNAMCRKQQHGLFTRMRLDRLKLLGDTLYDRCDKLHSTGDVKPSRVKSSQVSAPRPADAAALTRARALCAWQLIQRDTAWHGSRLRVHGPPIYQAPLHRVGESHPPHLHVKCCRPPTIHLAAVTSHAR